MADAVPYKFYLQKDGQGMITPVILPSYNQNNPDVQETDLATWKQYADRTGLYSNTGQQMPSTYKNGDWNPYGSSVYNLGDTSIYDRLSKDPTYAGLFSGGTSNSNMVLDNGTYTSQSAIDSTAAHEAAVAAGTEKKVPIGSGFGYVPTGSAGDMLSTGIANGTVSATNPQQQMAASMTGNNVNAPNIVPQAPGTPPAQTMQTQSTDTQTAQPGQTTGQQGLQMPDFNKLVGQRQIPGQQQVEYFNTQTGEAFSDPQQLSDFVNSQGGQTTKEDVFSFLDQQKQQQQAQANDVLTQNGIDPNALKESASSQNPLITFADTYSKMLEQMGIPSVKAQLTEFNKKYADLQNELNDKISDINDNPWLTEGVRQKQIESLQNKYEGRTKILEGQIGTLEKMYSDGIDQAKFVAGQAVSMAHDQAVLDQQLVIQKMQLAEKALTAGDTTDIKEYTLAQSQGYQGSFLDWQKQSANLKAKSSGTGSLGGIFSAAQISASLNQIAGAFDNEAIVKQYNTIAETYNAVKSAGTSPTDDIQRIYAFAKIMDPNSAVREGEYKTVQDYSTSLLQRTGLKANRVFNNDGFLTDEARNFINTTLKGRLDSSYKDYQNVYSEYQRRQADVMAGKGNTITDYSQAFNPTTGSGSVDLGSLDFKF